MLNCNDRLDGLDGHPFRTWNISLDSTSGKSGIRQTRDLIVAHVRELGLELGIDVRAL